MNKQRRKKLGEAAELLKQAELIIRECAEEESDYLYNMPENLQGSEKYELAEETASLLEEIADRCDENIQELDNIV